MTCHVLHNQAWTRLCALHISAPGWGPEEESILLILGGLFVYKIFLIFQCFQFLTEEGQELGIMTDFQDV